MECFIVASNDIFIAEQKLVLRGDEAHHALRSLRMRMGERLIATDLCGTCYLVELSSGEGGNRNDLQAECTVIEVLPEYHEAKRNIVLAQAILQQPSRFEEILEKSTELGIAGINPLITERTEKEQINADRITRILREATKQVSRARIPMLFPPMNFKDAITESISGRIAVILHETAAEEASLAKMLHENVSTPITLFIGPEGGFTEAEVAFGQAQGAIVASLGARRLRAETAAIAAISLVSLLQ